MTGIEFLCPLFKVTSNIIGSRLDRDLQNLFRLARAMCSKLEEGHAIAQRIVGDSTVDMATYIDYDVSNDSLNETLILLLGRISNPVTITESYLACADVPTFDQYPTNVEFVRPTNVEVVTKYGR